MGMEMGDRPGGRDVVGRNPLPLKPGGDRRVEV